MLKSDVEAGVGLKSDGEAVMGTNKYRYFPFSITKFRSPLPHFPPHG